MSKRWFAASVTSIYLLLNWWMDELTNVQKLQKIQLKASLSKWIILVQSWFLFFIFLFLYFFFFEINDITQPNNEACQEGSQEYRSWRTGLFDLFHCHQCYLSIFQLLSMDPASICLCSSWSLPWCICIIFLMLLFCLSCVLRLHEFVAFAQLDVRACVLSVKERSPLDRGTKLTISTSFGNGQDCIRIPRGISEHHWLQSTLWHPTSCSCNAAMLIYLK